MADGPVIQEASDRAIERGVSLHTVLDTVRKFRQKDQTTPVVLMGYTNPVERYGYKNFATDAAKAGVDGVLMVDCPPEEMDEFNRYLDENELYPICLLAPTTTSERIEFVARQARGYLYYVSFKGITGADRLDQAEIAGPLEEIRKHTALPIAVGFGIKDATTATAVARFADAVVIGSALVKTLANSASSEQAGQAARQFLAPVRKAMDNGLN